MTVFQKATRDDVSLMLDWATSEGWNPGIDDAEAFFEADPDGFFLALNNGEPAAAISVVNHTDSFSFLGLYIAVPRLRGKGIGFALWQHAVQHAGERTIGLDGVPEQQANYAASGFKEAGGTTRFFGRIEQINHNLRIARQADIPKLIQREADASGVRKDAYHSAWFSNTPNRTTFLDEQGFCTVRRCRSQAKVGPLIADTPDAALRLLQHASYEMGPELTIDVPDRSVVLFNLCRTLDLMSGFQTARMYRGSAPVSRHSLFAVTSLELG